MKSPSPGVKDKKSFLLEFEPLYEHLVERDEFLSVLIFPWLFIILQVWNYATLMMAGVWKVCV